MCAKTYALLVFFDVVWCLFIQIRNNLINLRHNSKLNVRSIILNLLIHLTILFHLPLLLLVHLLLLLGIILPINHGSWLASDHWRLLDTLLIVAKLVLSYTSTSHVLNFVAFETHLLQSWVLLLVTVLNVDLWLGVFNLLVVSLERNLWVSLLLNDLLLSKLLLLLLLNWNLVLMLILHRLHCHSAPSSRYLSTTSAWSGSSFYNWLPMHLIRLSWWNQILITITHVSHHLLHLRLYSQISSSNVS